MQLLSYYLTRSEFNSFQPQKRYLKALVSEPKNCGPGDGVQVLELRASSPRWNAMKHNDRSRSLEMNFEELELCSQCPSGAVPLSPYLLSCILIFPKERLNQSAMSPYSKEKPIAQWHFDPFPVLNDISL